MEMNYVPKDKKCAIKYTIGKETVYVSNGGEVNNSDIIELCIKNIPSSFQKVKSQ